MHTTSLVRRHIFRLPLGQIFTTREFLDYGHRPAVDKALGRLVKRGLIIRLARGVFVREGSQLPSLFEIARAKAEAFGKKILRHCADLAKELGLIEQGNPGPTFAVSGSSSYFRCGNTVIHLKGIGPRKMGLGESKAGQAARALWHRGKENFTPAQIGIATQDFLRQQDRAELRRFGRWLPAWLNAYLVTPRSWVPIV